MSGTLPSRRWRSRSRGLRSASSSFCVKCVRGRLSPVSSGWTSTISRRQADTERFSWKDGEMNHLKAEIREIPDWPKKGILFYDVTTLLKKGPCFRQVIDGLIEPYRDKNIDLVVGIEARGFIFAPTVAYALGAGFVPVRKPGKLPAATHRVS